MHQLLGPLGLECNQALDDAGDVVGTIGVVVGHAQLVEALATHRLQYDHFFQGFYRLLVLPQSRMGQAHSIPGHVLRRHQAYGLGKGGDRFLGLACMFHIAEVEPVGAIVGSQRQRRLEPLFGNRPVLALCGNCRELTRRCTSCGLRRNAVLNVAKALSSRPKKWNSQPRA